MAVCKFCQKPMQWGQSGDGWVPLVPIGEDDGLDRNYQDENGVLRAQHRLVCTAGPAAIRVTKLAIPVPGDMVMPTQTVETTPKKPRGRRRIQESVTPRNTVEVDPPAYWAS